MELYFYWLFGLIIHLAFKLQTAYKKDDFKWKIFIKKHWVGSIIVLLVGIPAILMRDTILAVAGLDLNELNCLLLAYSGDSGIKKFLNRGKSKIEKSINEK